MKKNQLSGMILMAVLAISSCKKSEKVIQRPIDVMVNTFAGSGGQGKKDGTGRLAYFSYPANMTSDASGNIYIVDQGNHIIRKMTPDGVVSTVAGSGIRGYADGPAATAQFSSPIAVAVDGTGNLFVVDNNNSCIRKITPQGEVSTLAGLPGASGFADGTGLAAKFDDPCDIAIDASNNLLVGDVGNARIRKITPAGVVSTFVGNGSRDLVNGPIATATMKAPRSITIDKVSGNIYVGQEFFIRQITPDGMVSVISGSSDDPLQAGTYRNGGILGARYNNIGAICCDKNGNIYVADIRNNVVRKITIARGTIETYAGQQYNQNNSTDFRFNDGAALTSLFSQPTGLVFDKEGNLLVSDKVNHSIRKISEVPLPDSPEEQAQKNWNKPKEWK